MGELEMIRAVLPIKVDATSGAVFAQLEGAREDVEAVSVSRALFEELGRPQFVTVTVEPGDLLNSEGRQDGER